MIIHAFGMYVYKMGRGGSCVCRNDVLLTVAATPPAWL